MGKRARGEDPAAHRNAEAEGPKVPKEQPRPKGARQERALQLPDIAVNAKKSLAQLTTAAAVLTNEAMKESEGDDKYEVNGVRRSRTASDDDLRRNHSSPSHFSCRLESDVIGRSVDGQNRCSSADTT